MTINIGQQSVIKDGLIVALDASNFENYLPLTAVEVLVVAGGGGGGFGETNINGGGAGGGGGGGVVYSTSYSVTAGSNITVTVGNGGSSAANESTISNNGQNSVFGNITAIGGGGAGGGGVEGNSTGNSGGSGGGAGGDGNTVATGGAGTPGQGFAGAGRISTRNRSGSGGGGAGSIGTPGYASGSYGIGGKGGNGLLFNISGIPRYYGGGGGASNSQNFGAATTYSGGAGGAGGGGRGAPTPAGSSGSAAAGEAGTANTGGGGGGGYGTSGGTGGSGVVIVRYPGPQKATGGTITNINGYTIHTFTGSGTFTPLTEAQLKSTFYGLSDLSGNNNVAIAVNGPTYTTENGGGIVFDGIDDYLILNHSYPHPRTIDFNTSTVIYVAKLSSSPNSRNTVFSQYTGSGAQHELQSSGYLRSNYRDASATTPELDAPNGTGQIASNTVYHIAITYGQKTIAHYKNGVLLGSLANSSHNDVNGATQVNIGRNNAAGLYFKGTIYHVLVYDRVLSDSEILKNFNAVKARFGL